MIHVSNALLTLLRAMVLTVSFSQRDVKDIMPHEDDIMLINLQIYDWSVKRVLIDPNSSAYILYWEAFQVLKLDPELLQPFKGSLVRFSGEQVQVLDYITIKITFKKERSAKIVKVRYMVINVLPSYNIIMCMLAFNAFEAVMSTL